MHSTRFTNAFTIWRNSLQQSAVFISDNLPWTEKKHVLIKSSTSFLPRWNEKKKEWNESYKCYIACIVRFCLLDSKSMQYLSVSWFKSTLICSHSGIPKVKRCSLNNIMSFLNVIIFEICICVYTNIRKTSCLNRDSFNMMRPILDLKQMQLLQRQSKIKISLNKIFTIVINLNFQLACVHSDMLSVFGWKSRKYFKTF